MKACIYKAFYFLGHFLDLLQRGSLKQLYPGYV